MRNHVVHKCGISASFGKFQTHMVVVFFRLKSLLKLDMVLSDPTWYSPITQAPTLLDQMNIWSYVTQCSDVWGLSRSEYTFLWKHQFELIFHIILLKMYRFNFFMTKLLRKIFLMQYLDFCGRGCFTNNAFIHWFND